MLAGNLIHNLQVGMEISGDKLLASQSRNEKNLYYKTNTIFCEEN